MNINFIVFYGFTVLLIVILLDKPIESQTLIMELLKILVSGYLGYLIKDLEQ
jgi:hypothetical protein